MYLSFALFLIATILVFLTFRHYGVSWDERLQWEYGEKVYQYYSSLFRDNSWASTGDLVYYGGFFEIIAVLAARSLPLGIYETRHVITALWGIAGILASWKTARILAGPKAAFWAALLLLLFPSFYGHMFINSKDIPFAVLYAWSLYCLIRIALEFPRISTQRMIQAGLVIGMTMAVRVGGLILLFYLYVLFSALFAHLLWKRGGAHVADMPIAKMARAAVMQLAYTTVIAYGVMLVFWPYAARNPFKNPWEALARLSHVHPIASSVDYLPRHLFIKFPELVIVLIVIGSFLGIRGLMNQKGGSPFLRAIPFLVLVLAAAIPIFYAMVTRPFL